MRVMLLTALLMMSLWAQSHSAKVLETLNSGGYTYIKVQEGSERYWIAMTERSVKVGEVIAYDEQGWMQDFHSKTLKRTFKKILFASAPSTVTAPKQTQVKADVMHSKYATKRTISIAELVANREKYASQKVQVRAKVTKTSAQIMKRNWVHLQDGSSFQGFDDLVFTTTGKMPKVGDIVTAEGKVTLDKDFGYGYFYPVIVEEATFK